MTDIINDIRMHLRRSMNGVASSRLWGRGVGSNFGVPLPRLREIAEMYEKEAGLAQALWVKDAREFKILATLLYPLESFTAEKAEEWVVQICHKEIAEQLCWNLLRHLPFGKELVHKWIFREEEFVKVSAFLLFARLCTKGVTWDEAFSAQMLEQAKKVMDEGESRLQRAAVLALKRYGCQNKEQAATVLKKLEGYASSGSPEKQEFFHDIKFEFDYYL